MPAFRAAGAGRGPDPRAAGAGRTWGEAFARSLWYRLAAVLSEGDATRCQDVRPARDPRQGTYCFLAPGDRLLARLLDASEASLRFLERAGKAPRSNRSRDRAGLIRKVAAVVSGGDEKRMNEAGVLTIRQTAEQSFWGALRRIFPAILRAGPTSDTNVRLGLKKRRKGDSGPPRAARPAQRFLGVAR